VTGNKVIINVGLNYCTVGVADMMCIKCHLLWSAKEKNRTDDARELYTWQLTVWHAEIAVTD